MATDMYSDIKVDFAIDKKTKDLVKNTNEEAVKNAIKNILLCKKMERRMMPEFGASLEKLLFEPVDQTTSKRIGEIMFDELMYWEPRIVIINLSVTADMDYNRYDVSLTYYIKSTVANQSTINFTLQ